MASKSYEIAFRLGAKMNRNYVDTFSKAEQLAKKTAGAIKNTVMAIGGTVLAGVGVTDAVEKAMSFESAMADVAKTVDGLKDSTGHATKAYYAMSSELLDMTSYLPMTAEELSQIAAAAGQAGIASKDLTKFTETAAKMGIAFDVTAEQAGAWMAVWRTSFKMNQDEVTTLADQINYLSNTSSENATKLSGVVSRIGALGEISGVSAAQVAALAAGMTGVTEEISATGIKNLMKAMNAGSAATDKQCAVLDRLGFSASKMAERMQTDAGGAILDLLSAFKKLPEAEQSAALTEYFGSESVAAIAPLINNLGNLKSQFEKVGDASLYAGSMEAEFATRAATTENSVKLIENAIDRLKISFGNLLLPIVNKGAKELPDLIEKLEQTLPKLESQTKKTWKSVSPVLHWIQANPTLVADFIIGIGATIASYKVVKGIEGMAFALKTLGVSIMVNPVVLAATAIIAAIALIAIQVHRTKEKLKREDLAAHFGSIAMSAEELSDVAKRIVQTNNLGKLGEALNSLGKVDRIRESIDSAVAELNKLNWKVSIGLKLDESDIEKYKSNIDSFIKDSQDILAEKRLAISLVLEVFTTNDAAGNAIKASVDAFYAANCKEVASLGTKLRDTVNAAFADGILDVDEQKAISELQGKIAKITNALAKSQFEAKLEVLGMDFSGKALTGESFQTLQDKIGEEIVAASAQYKEGLTNVIANEKIRLDAGNISYDQYIKNVKMFKEQYIAQISDLQSRAMGFQMDTVFEAYAGDLKGSEDEINKIFNQGVNDLMAALSSNDANISQATIFENIKQQLNSLGGLSEATKGNLKDIYENMKPTIELQRQLVADYTKMGKEIPENVKRDLANADLLGALIGETDSIGNVIGEKVAGSIDLTEAIEKAAAQGKEMPEEFAKSIDSGKQLVKSSAEGMVLAFKATAQTELAKGVRVTMPIQITMSSSGAKNIPEPDVVSQVKNPLKGIRKFATGTNYSPDTFIAGEAGAELITDRKGSKVFTALQTGTVLNNLTKLPTTIHNATQTILTNLFSTDNDYSGYEGMGILPNQQKLPMFAKGSNNTPDTFIAGEAGAELITDRKGSKVFTALQTGTILNNLTKIPTTIHNVTQTILTNLLSTDNDISNYESSGILPNQQKFPMFAKGSNNTPDTFIAGEAGAELITDRKGSKVFTALQTGTILNNLTKIPTTIHNATQTILTNLLSTDNKFSEYENLDLSTNNQTSTDRPLHELRTVQNTSSYNAPVHVTYSPQIKIEGDTGNRSNADLQRLIQDVLMYDRASLEQIVRDVIRSDQSRKGRLANA